MNVRPHEPDVKPQREAEIAPEIAAEIAAEIADAHGITLAYLHQDRRGRSLPPQRITLADAAAHIARAGRVIAKHPDAGRDTAPVMLGRDALVSAADAGTILDGGAVHGGAGLDLAAAALMGPVDLGEAARRGRQAAARASFASRTVSRVSATFSAFRVTSSITHVRLTTPFS